MAEVLLFHHANGLTQGCLAFAETLREAGHAVHAPDLYDGMTFTDLDEGVAHSRDLGFETILERGRVAVEGLPAGIVYAGMSLGVMPAQMLAQTRPGAAGAVLLHGAVQPEELGGEWPQGLPLQMHTMEDDAWGDVDVARSLAETIPGAELYVYPGHVHLFTDSSLDDYDEGAATSVTQRVLAFLEKL